MKQSQKALWDNCLEIIRQNVSEQQFKTWFAPIELESFKEDTKEVMLKLPSMYVYEYLEEYYVQLLSKVLRRCFDPNVILTYRVVTDKTHELGQDLPSQQTAVGGQRPMAAGANQSPTMMDAAAYQDVDPHLNPEKTFRNFVEGYANKLPRTVGLSIAEHPGKSTFNPFFVFGPSGCGKTHLINAVGLRCKELFPQKKVLYVSARLFQVQYTDAVRKNTTNDFINFYQKIDVLIVDDIQEWATSPKTLDTFFHIFDHLFRLGHQIILACDRPPVDLEGVKDRLLTRFSCGLIAELEKPDEQLCTDILTSFCLNNGLKISADVLQYIAKTANGNVRDLEGVVNSLLAHSIVYNTNVDMRLAERIIKRAVKIDDKPLTADDILEQVCQHYNVSVQNVFSKSRKQDYVKVRQISMYLAQKYTKMPASRIGQLIGNRDHSTVIHSCTTVANKLKVDKAFAAEITSIENSFKLKKGNR